MSIQFLCAWNGYEQHQVATLSVAEESRLVGLGLARVFFKGIDGESGLSVSTLDLASLAVFSDAGISHIASGLALPSVGTNALAAVSAGAAYVNGARCAYSGGTPGFSNGDNYCDLAPQGVLVVTTVAQAAAAPAIPVNAIRLGYVRCVAGSVTASFTGAKDSLGNWMGNRTPKASCILHAAPNSSFTSGSLPYAFSAAANTTQELDNCGMHSIVTNNTRITAQRSGLYQVSGCLQWSTGTIQEMRLFKNGVFVKGIPEAFFGSNTTALSASIAGQVYMNAGDYIELKIDASAAPYIYNASFSAVQL